MQKYMCTTVEQKKYSSSYENLSNYENISKQIITS